MTRIEYIKFGIRTVPQYPECPYGATETQMMSKTKWAENVLVIHCRHPNAMGRTCTSNHGSLDSRVKCPFDIHKELQA